jgi:hypothetical protein
MSDQHFAVAESDDDNDVTIVILTAMLVEVSPAQLESFKKEALLMLKSNESVVAMSSGMSNEGPVGVFHFSYPYSPNDRMNMEEWLRRHPLVWRIRFEEDVPHKH